ncbi:MULTISPECIES: hypothetical protein [Lacticaseibacillus]|uniref:hypothetical protein n=1 Tax=Lacticaseibacillus TaxID=2759736 RepID=UPI000A7D92CE|nr:MULTISPECIES: hypothetical protein [Lacticaseibacillus]
MAKVDSKEQERKRLQDLLSKGIKKIPQMETAEQDKLYGRCPPSARCQTGL